MGRVYKLPEGVRRAAGFSTPSAGPLGAGAATAVEFSVLLYVGQPSQPAFPPAPLHLPSPGQVPGVGRSTTAAVGGGEGRVEVDVAGAIAG